MSNMFPVLLMICAGAAVALQPSINARLAQKVGFLQSACISFTVGAVALFIAILCSGRYTVKGLADSAWWEWTGGLFGAFFVSATILAVPRIGTAAAMAATITAQLLVGLILDHFRLFGYGAGPIDLKRSLGALFLITGAALIIRR